MADIESARSHVLVTRGSLGTATDAERDGRPMRSKITCQAKRAPWPLILILACQAGLALRLAYSDTAFNDEALYLWAGHLVWASWLHGQPLPGFAYYFSGDPLLYPPIGAVADSLGGLVAARIMSLAFMLGATTLLWATAARMYGRPAAFFAAALWALLGPTLHVSALATFDAMSMLMMALAVYCASRLASAGSSSGWAVIAGISLGIANLAAYSSLIFDPIVVLFFVVAASGELDFRSECSRLFEMVICGGAVIFAAIGVGGYLSGATETVFNRASGVTTSDSVIQQTWSWISVVVVIAGLSVLFCVFVRAQRRQLAQMIVLLVAGVIVPIEQARIHTATSLDKHVDMGAWFAAIAAGFLLGRAGSEFRSANLRKCAIAVGIIVVAIAGVINASQAPSLYNWANVAQFVRALRPLALRSNGPLLVEDPSPARYYLGSTIRWQRWSSTFSVMLPDMHNVRGVSEVATAGQPKLYVELVNRSFFDVVALDFHSGDLDRQIINAMTHSRNYRFVTQVPYGAGRYVIWERVP